MCEIDNDAYVHSMPQWISGELFVGSGKKYADLKEKQVLYSFSGTERKGCLLCFAGWIYSGTSLIRTPLGC